MTTETDRRPGQTRALVLATLAFGVCFYAWSLLGPLAPDLQKQLDLSELQTAVMVAVPVLLGAVLRVPLGLLTDRHGGRRIFTALMIVSLLPLIGLALIHDSYAVILLFGLALGITGASFAVGVPFVNGWYAAGRQGFALGIYNLGPPIGAALGYQHGDESGPAPAEARTGKILRGRPAQRQRQIEKMRPRQPVAIFQHEIA